MDLNEIIKRTVNNMQANNRFEVVRQKTVYSWGDFKQCKNLFITVFNEVDKTIKNFKYIPEYDNIVQWMTNTDGKGLLLIGAKGRGKSTILTCVIPVLFNLKRLVVKPVQAIDFCTDEKLTLLNYLKNTNIPVIDELGLEPFANNYGEKFEGFNFIIDKAEQKIKPLFITTNLSAEQILSRYGSRTTDRIGRLCKTVVFKGDSLR